MANEHLGDAVRFGEADNLAHGVGTLQYVYVGAQADRVRDDLLEQFVTFPVSVTIFDMDRQQLAVERSGSTSAAFQDGPGAALRRDADEDALLCAPALLD